MSFSSLKKTNPIYFYFVSIIAFVLANIMRTTSNGLYYGLLIVGVIFFFLGLMRRIKK